MCVLRQVSVLHCVYAQHNIRYDGNVTCDGKSEKCHMEITNIFSLKTIFVILCVFLRIKAML